MSDEPRKREVWTPEQAAEFLQIHKRTVTTLAVRSELPAFRVGNLWRFYRDDLESLTVKSNG